MPNIITSRPPRVLVGADQVEFSLLAFDWVTGDDALSEDGVISKTATATLGKVQSGLIPESIDPEINPERWRPRQPILFQVKNSAGIWVPHPAGYLIMLSEPEYDPDAGQLSLDLGDWLAWGGIKDKPPGEDVINTEMGVDYDFSEWCQMYLELAGIPAANINLGGPWGYPKNVPDSKPGNPITQAGKYAWSAGHRYLYQDKSGIVRARQTETAIKETPDLIIDLRVWGLEAKRVQGGEEPVEIVRVAGTGKRAEKTDSSITESYTDGDFSHYSQESYRFGGAVLGRGFAYAPSKTMASRLSRVQLKQPGNIAFQQGGTNTRVVVSDKTTIRYYEPYPESRQFPWRMYYSFSYEEKAAGLINGGDSALTERFRESSINYEFDEDGRVRKITETTWAREREFIKGGSIQWRKIKVKTQEWKREGIGLYSYESIERAAKITTQSYDGNIFSRWSLVIDRQPERRPAEGRGKNEPPAPEEWEGPWLPKESEYEGEAYWQHRGGYVGEDRIRPYQIPQGLAVSDDQCIVIAGIQRDLLDGRKQGRLLRLPIVDELLDLDFPLFQARITFSDTETRTYLIDSLSWEHQPSAAFCAAFGILLGEVNVPVSTNLRGGLWAGGRLTAEGGQGYQLRGGLWAGGVTRFTEAGSFYARGGLWAGGRLTFREVILYSLRGGLWAGGRAHFGESLAVFPKVGDHLNLMYRVSSEESYDFLEVLVTPPGGATAAVLTVSGDSGWVSGEGLYQFAEVGTHTIRVEYNKDGSVNSNEDTAWIDEVSISSAATLAGSDRVEVVEDFEDSEFPIDWIVDGTYGWAIASDSVGAGIYSLKSQLITDNHNQAAWVQFTLDVVEAPGGAWRSMTESQWRGMTEQQWRNMED